jgi:tRNA A37 threonylcarbamoyladenosine modification protein TsaB
VRPPSGIGLLLDTSDLSPTQRVQMALVYNGDVLWRWHAQAAGEAGSVRGDAAPLLGDLKAGLAGVGLTPKELSWLGVNLGPGRFTGLRIGVMIARTLNQALSVPVMGWQSFEVIAASCGALMPGESTGVVLPYKRGVWHQGVVHVGADNHYQLETGLWEPGHPLPLADQWLVPEGCLDAVKDLAAASCWETLLCQLGLAQRGMLAGLNRLSEQCPQPWLRHYRDILPAYLAEPTITPPKRR